MWISASKLLDYFKISQTSFDDLRAEVASLRVERDHLKSELLTSRIQQDWLRMQVNTLQFERTALMDRAYGIKVPAPELARSAQPFNPSEFSFDDLGDEVAKKLGLPLYSEPRPGDSPDFN